MTNLYFVFRKGEPVSLCTVRADTAEEAATRFAGAGREDTVDVILVATNIEPVELRPQYAAPPRKGDA